MPSLRLSAGATALTLATAVALAAAVAFACLVLAPMPDRRDRAAADALPCSHARTPRTTFELPDVLRVTVFADPAEVQCRRIRRRGAGAD